MAAGWGRGLATRRPVHCPVLISDVVRCRSSAERVARCAVCLSTRPSPLLAWGVSPSGRGGGYRNRADGRTVRDVDSDLRHHGEALAGSGAFGIRHGGRPMCEVCAVTAECANVSIIATHL